MVFIFKKGLNETFLDGTVLTKATGGHQCLLAAELPRSRNDANTNDNLCSVQCHSALRMCEGPRSLGTLMEN